jgi:hypothetical protein
MVRTSDLLLPAVALLEVGFELVSLNLDADDYATGGLVPPSYCVGGSRTSDKNDGDGLSLTIWMFRTSDMNDSDVGGASQGQL